MANTEDYRKDIVAGGLGEFLGKGGNLLSWLIRF